MTLINKKYGQNIEMRIAEETQILLVLGITKTVNPLVFIIHICSVHISHVCYGTIHLLIHSVSQKLPSPSQSNQTLSLVQQVPTAISRPPLLPTSTAEIQLFIVSLLDNCFCFLIGSLASTHFLPPFNPTSSSDPVTQ